MKHIISDIMSVVLTTFVFLLGGWDIALQSLIIMLVIDYLTGLASAYYNKKLNSKVGFKGIIKKVCYLLIVTVSVVVDNLISDNGIIRTMVIYFFVANDGLSIIENMAEMNIKIPKKLKEALEQLRKDNK